MDHLTVKDVHKNYDGAPLLCGVSMDVESGEIHCLLGQSGSGKSTLLRIIAGLESPEKGQISWNGKDVTGTPVYLRKFGLMFQDYALFPHRSVAENVAFGLEMQRLPGDVVDQKVREALDRVNMGGFAGRSVTDLSGGEQQRVALARSLAANPLLLMLDEPLAALDRSLRLELQQELKFLLHQANIPVIYVTHDQEEAVVLGDKMSILHDGRIIQSGTPEEVFATPVSRWAAEFLGMQNFIEGTVISVNPLRVSTFLGIFTVHHQSEKIFPVDLKVILMFKKDFYSVSNPVGDGNLISGVVHDCDFRENGYQVVLDVGLPETLVFLLPHRVSNGTRLTVQIPESSIVIIPG